MIHSGKNLFITGGGGRGKSWVIREATKGKPKETLLVAPTGIAALNVGGITAHKAFGLPLGIPTLKDKTMLSSSIISMFKKTSPIKKVVIDEACMLRVDMLELIDRRLQKVRGNKEPFGGIQFIMVGDGFQLEPIVSNREHKEFYSHYESPFVFTSSISWNFETIELTKNYRTIKPEQSEILDSFRKGSAEQLPYINSKLIQDIRYHEDALHLCSYNKDATTINNHFFKKKEGEVKLYKASYKGDNAKWKDAIVDDILELKIGLKVLICMNDPDGSYVNGDRGTIISLREEFVEVVLESGDTVFVIPSKWEKYKYTGTGKKLSKVVETTMTQIPLKLGYAVSIHKSQGMTLDKVTLDVGKGGCFSHGQLYVALSRIRDLDNLSLLRPITKSSIIVRQEVIDFYKALEK